MKEKDYMMWLSGMYNMRAFGVVMANAFGGKSDYFEKPICELASKSSDDEIMAKTNQLFASLQVMQSNFEMANKEKIEGAK